MAYATAQNLLDRYDKSIINDLVSDEGTRLSYSDLLVDTKLLAALDDASGEVDAALLVGGRYSATDLSGLTGNALATLVRITCEIAIGFLYNRRPMFRVEDADRWAERTRAHIDRLRTGENVFNIAANITAGNPTLDGPTSIDYRRLNLIPERTKNYYPHRSGVLPTDRG